MNVVADADLFGKEQVKPRKDIGKCLLEGECNCYTADAESRDDGGDLYAVVMQDDEYPHGVDEDV